MGTVHTRRLTREDPEFYQLLGPFLSRREIVRELGYPVWDDDGKVWYVAQEDGRVVGFAALRRDNGKTILTSAYVVPERRRQGIYRLLFDARLREALAPGTVIEAVVTPQATGMFEQRGFERVGMRGRYTRYRRVCE